MARWTAAEGVEPPRTVLLPRALMTDLTPRSSKTLLALAAEVMQRSYGRRHPRGVLALEEGVVQLPPRPICIVEVDAPTAPIHGVALRPQQVRHTSQQQQHNADGREHRQWMEDGANQPDANAN